MGKLLRESKRSIVGGLIWIIVTVVYSELYFRYLSKTYAYIVFAMLWAFSVVVVTIGFILCFPQVLSTSVEVFRARKLSNKSEFVKIGDTLLEQQNLVRALLFLDNL